MQIILQSRRRPMCRRAHTQQLCANVNWQQRRCVYRRCLSHMLSISCRMPFTASWATKQRPASCAPPMSPPHHSRSAAAGMKQHRRRWARRRPAVRRWVERRHHRHQRNASRSAQLTYVLSTISRRCNSRFTRRWQRLLRRGNGTRHRCT